MSKTQTKEGTVQVLYFPESNLLKIIWQGSIDTQKLESGYGQALQIISDKIVHRCLIDISQRRLEDAGADTVIKDTFRKLLQLISEPLFVALVTTPENYFMISDHFYYDTLRQDDNHYIIIGNFLNQEEAMAWLDSAPEIFLNG